MIDRAFAKNVMVGEALELLVLSFNGDAMHCGEMAIAGWAEHNITYCFTADPEFIFADLCHETFYQVAEQSPLIVTVSNNNCLFGGRFSCGQLHIRIAKTLEKRFSEI